MNLKEELEQRYHKTLSLEKELLSVLNDIKEYQDYIKAVDERKDLENTLSKLNHSCSPNYGLYQMNQAGRNQ